MKNENSYHHGDLRNTLITIGTEMLAEEGSQALSLRKLAKRAGVSHNAPYMHFADKEALLAAIAEEGFRLLSVAFEAAVQAAPAEDWPAQFQAGCWAYVQFALDHPDQLQMMIRPFEAAKYPSLSKTSLGALERLRELVAAGQAQGYVKTGDSWEIAGVVWSLLHGIATIWAGQKMPSAVMAGRSRAALTQAFAQHLYEGLSD
ncbi:MAG: TetR/AcrR family transcriptional regulator [Anaerolineae bacterium]|nr:TetR/AcrR family transcriptional regulator [Anaerolineae bacterium]